MKKILIGVGCGLLIGAGAVLGVMQIPSVNNALIKGDTNTDYVENTQDKNTIANLQNKNLILEENIKTLNNQLSAKTTELEQCNSDLQEKSEQLELKTTEIAQLQAEKEQLETINNTLQNVDIPNLTNEKIALEEENADLKEELDYYKELSGSSEDYLTIIENLESTISAKDTELETANNQITQLTQEKQDLENQITALNTELESVKEELAKYKVLGEIDHLQVSSYQGTWYKDGTFADYYIIDDGVVTHNANEDTGIVQCLNNQMYLFMNNNGSTPVTLASDGLSFTTEDGTLYTKFYVNTTEDTTSDIINIARVYLYNNESYTLKQDNSLEYKIDDSVYYGAYTYSSIKRNIGGNITITNYITATINKDNETITKNFSVVNGIAQMLDIDENIMFYATELSSAVNINMYTPSSTENGYKFVVKTKDYVTIEKDASVSFYITGSTYSNSYFNLNGIGATSSSMSITNYTGSDIKSKYFVFYLYPRTTGRDYSFSDIYKIGSSNSEIISVEKFGDGEINSYLSLGTDLQALFNSNNSEFSSIMMDSISDYTNGTYSNADISVSVSDDTTTITPIGSESITATDCVINAKTDGYKIYHTITITYTTIELVEEVETEVTNTIVLNLENDNLVSSTLNEVAIELTKN